MAGLTTQAAAGATILVMAAACAALGLPRLPEPGVSAVDAAPPIAAEVVPDSAASPDARDCFTRHLREAITLNRRRAEVYSRWSEGESEPISRRLIRLERVALPVAGHVDRRARRFQAAGIPVGCAEFVAMAMTPALDSAPSAPPPEPFRPGPDADSLREALIAAYGAGGFPAVAEAADRSLHRLGRPEYHCMLRHMLESMRRVAQLAPLHAAAAGRAGLPSPVPLSELLLRLHLGSLRAAADLDADAAPLQEAGIPIVCRDVPPIPPVDPARSTRID